MNNRINTKDVVYREDLYPRINPDPVKIQQYSESIELLPPIEVSQDNILIDGYHRWKAHETAGVCEIPVIVTPVESEAELLRLAVERNATHGLQLSQKEKRKYALRWWDIIHEEEICRTLSISPKLFREWTRDRQRQKDEEIRQQIFDMWLSCHTQEEIAQAVGVAQQTVSDRIADFTKNDGNSDIGNFSNFSPELYSVWNFGKATNEVRHFGNIPPEIIENLLYYYTRPFDVVFDPFGGGGSTIDKCRERKRRYYVSDLTPIPARDREIRKQDITQGLPADLPVPDLVFLDPPYWRQAEGKYSALETDLANVSLDQFLETIGNIARDVKRKWSSRKAGTLALIIGPWKQDGQYVDLAFLCYERIAKYLDLKHRVIVPYSTQIHGGAFVQMAKEKKEILYLHRDLMIFGYGA